MNLKNALYLNINYFKQLSINQFATLTIIFFPLENNVYEYINISNSLIEV